MSKLLNKLNELYGGPLGDYVMLQIEPHLMKEIIRDLRRLDTIRGNRKPWSEECRKAIFEIEDIYDIEVVSIEHHSMFVDRLERAEEFIRDVRISNREWHNKRNQFLASTMADVRANEESEFTGLPEGK